MLYRVAKKSTFVNSFFIKGYITKLKPRYGHNDFALLLASKKGVTPSGYGNSEITSTDLYKTPTT